MVASADSGIPEAPTSNGSIGQQTKEPKPGTPYGTNKPVKLIIVGAGIAGVAAAVVLSQKVPNLSYTVYEKNNRVGGTWAENVYPGIRCDVPSHIYQLTVAPNTQWPEYYARGEDIQAYYGRVCRDYGVDDHLKLRHQVVGVRWVEETYLWEVQVQDLDTGEVKTDHADFFVCAQGRINKPFIPDIPGLQSFQGQVIHSSQWPKDFRYEDKRVAVVGNGASGQQVLSNLVQKAARIDHYVRSGVYVPKTFRDGLIPATVDNRGAHIYTEEEKKTFRDDGNAYQEYRRDLSKLLATRLYGISPDGGDVQELKQRIFDDMLNRLEGNQAWLERVKPTFDPGCKRLTPTPGYLEALIGPKVDYVDSGIAAITPTGIQGKDGKVREVDIIIFATGFKDGYFPRFPAVGRDGDLSQNWRPGGKIGYPRSYLGVMAPDMPNYFTVMQAHGTAFGGSVPLHCEVASAYIARVIRKLRRDGYRVGSPKREAAEEFNDWLDKHFENSAQGGDCNSWFKLDGPGSRVVIGWPGSTRHRIETLAEPRWEDFEFELDTRAKGFEKNRFGHWGAGQTLADIEGDLEVLIRHVQKPEDVDFKRLHESAYL